MDQSVAHDASLDNKAETARVDANNQTKDAEELRKSAKIAQKHIESRELTPGGTETVEVSESIDVKETVEVGSTTHEKRGMRPSPKSIENRMELDSGTLERYWDKVMTVVSEHRESYPHDSVNQIRAATREIRAQFHQYQTRWLSYMDFLALANTSECQGEREAMDKVMNNRSEFEEHNSRV